MKKIIFSTMIASLLAFVGCQNEELVNENTNNGGEKVILTANIQGAADSRVVLTPGKDDDDDPIVKVAWNESGETFKVYGYNSSRSDYSGTPTWFTQIEGTNQFEGILPESDNGTYLAVYGDDLESKYNPLQYSLAGQDGTLTDCQSISTEGETFYLHYVLMRDTIADLSSSIEYEHETAILKPTFKVGDTDIDNTITQIVMGNVIFPTTDNDVIEEITIIPHLAEQIQSASGTTFTMDDEIYIHLPMAYIPDGKYSPNHEFTFTVTAGDTEYTGSLTIPNGMSIEAGNLYTAEVRLEIKRTPYLTFSAEEEQQLTMTVKGNNVSLINSLKTLEYSLNGVDWGQLNADTPIAFGGSKGDLLLRGKSSIGTAINYSNYSTISFSNEVAVACSGDIRTLVDWENYAQANTQNARFCYLFSMCEQITTAPELPATTLSDWCYYHMFYGCENINSVTMLATDISATSCLTGWMSGVPTGEGKGTFTKAAVMTSLPTGASGIPSGWTVQDYVAPGEGN